MFNGYMLYNIEFRTNVDKLKFVIPQKCQIAKIPRVGDLIRIDTYKATVCEVIFKPLSKHDNGDQTHAEVYLTLENLR